LTEELFAFDTARAGATPERAPADLSREGAGPDGGVLAAISNAVVQTMKREVGKGPTKAKTYVADRYVFVVLQEVLTTAEKGLLEAGQDELVRAGRRHLHERAMPAVRAEIEAQLGRRVSGGMTQVLVDTDTQIQVFVLE
jgi:uncharacterized protein YbcI